jgi:hypothetical protein
VFFRSIFEETLFLNPVDLFTVTAVCILEVCVQIVVCVCGTAGVFKLNCTAGILSN